MFVEFESTVKGGLPCEVEATVFWEHNTRWVTDLTVYWPSRVGKKRRVMPDHLIKADLIFLEEQAFKESEQ